MSKTMPIANAVEWVEAKLEMKSIINHSSQEFLSFYHDFDILTEKMFLDESI
jgi:hypothetical protein